MTMTSPEWPVRRPRTGDRQAAGAGAIAAALLLSSCSAIGLSERQQPAAPAEPGYGEAPKLAAPDRPAGEPLQLISSTAFAWVDQAAPRSEAATSGTDPVDPARAEPSETPPTATSSPAELLTAGRPVGEQAQPVPADRSRWADEAISQTPARTGAVGSVDAARTEPLPASSEPVPQPMAFTLAGRSTGEPLQLIATDAMSWVDESAARSVAMVSGPEAVGAIWTGLPLNTDPLAMASRMEPAADSDLPLLVADGEYHYPVDSAVAEPAETPCLRAAGLDIAEVACTERTDQIAMAPQTVDDSMLAEQRGGFITVSGFQIDFGIHVETLVDGITQLTTSLTLDDVINGSIEGLQIGQITLNTDGGATDIVHNVSVGDINTIINNSQDDVDITTLGTLAVNVINLQQPQIGNSFGASPRMMPELQQSIIRGIGP